MKVAILGYSGSGKSTLAEQLANKWYLPLLHLDKVQFLPHWQERPLSQKMLLVEQFLNQHQIDGWVIDGTYSKLSLQRRLDEADVIVLMLAPWYVSLYRVLKRRWQYRTQTITSIAEGCEEKMDWTFLRWVVFDGRTPSRRQLFADIHTQHAGKVVVLNSHRQTQAWLSGLKGLYPKPSNQSDIE